MQLDDAPHPPADADRARRGAKRGTRGGRTGLRNKGPSSQVRPTRRRNRRADQFCVYTGSDERRTPIFAVEFKAPHKLTVTDLQTGLHEMDLERDVINQEGDTFEFYATHLVAAVATQIFSYMHDSGVAYGCIRTGEAFVFLHIPADPTVLEYFLCVPNKDVLEDDEHRLHRTAIGQMLAFTLQALAAEPPSQEWKETADKELATWEVEYLDVLRGIPETIRKEPPPSNYRPSHWKPVPKEHNTRSRARCKQGASTPHGSPNEDSSSDGDIPSPTPAPIVGSRSRRGNKDSSAGGRAHSTTNKSQAYSRTERPSYPYCTVACIRGLINKDILDEKCPNFEQHRGPKHPINALEFKRMLHQQLVQDREEGFEPLDIRGRTGYIIKATLLSHGYTVVIKATIEEKKHRLQEETNNYRRLRSLQGYQIPVCLGAFTPRVKYWYHGDIMTYMMILSWSGARLQFVVNDANISFFQEKRDKALAVLLSNGVKHKDKEWRNMLWDEHTGHLAVIDLEDIEWVKRRPPLQSKPDNTQGEKSTRTRKNKKRCLASASSRDGGALELGIC
ncbi:hypothetical protein I7I48_06573 [Histoplasma ohiense]|nr:hypothetical protein I7I48_06573 [Histoplasma ohiense (nom. inval.)]